MCLGCLIFLVRRPCPPLIFSIPLFVLTSLSRLLHCFLTQLIPSLSTFSILLPFQLSLSLCHTVTSYELLDNPTNWNTSTNWTIIFDRFSPSHHTLLASLLVVSKCSDVDCLDILDSLFSSSSFRLFATYLLPSLPRFFRPLVFLLIFYIMMLDDCFYCFLLFVFAEVNIFCTETRRYYFIRCITLTGTGSRFVQSIFKGLCLVD